ncbi:hypothetical protein Ancab_033794 [Ancistrocladus abbreviatus]
MRVSMTPIGMGAQWRTSAQREALAEQGERSGTSTMNSGISGNNDGKGSRQACRFSSSPYTTILLSFTAPIAPENGLVLRPGSTDHPNVMKTRFGKGLNNRGAAKGFDRWD